MDVSGVITARWVGPYGTDDLDEAEGEPCTSVLAEAGEPVRVTPSGADGVSTNLTSGEISSGRCTFAFSTQAAQAESYKVEIGKYAGDFDTDDPTDLVMNLPAIFNAAEESYLKASKVKGSDNDKEFAVADGWQACNDLKLSGDRAGRITSIAEPDFDRKAILYLCPRYKKELAAAEGAFTDGDYAVPDDIKPGRYKTLGPTRECYWERGTSGGDILDNDFVTNAPGGVRVTIRPSDGAFSSTGCDLWVKN